MRLSRACFPLLSELLSVVARRSGPSEEEAVLREAGRALIAGRSEAGSDMRRRAAAAVDPIAEPGGMSSVSREGDGLSIHSRAVFQRALVLFPARARAVSCARSCCFLRALVPDHPLVRNAVESMLTEFMGVPVREACERDPLPSCLLAIATDGRQ